MLSGALAITRLKCSLHLWTLFHKKNVTTCRHHYEIQLPGSTENIGYDQNLEN